MDEAPANFLEALERHLVRRRRLGETRHAGNVISQRLRKRVEEIFGWGKTVGGMRRSRFKGRARTQLFALIVGTAYNLMRMAKILRKPVAA